MPQDCLIYVGNNAIAELIKFAETYRKLQFTIVCDKN